MSLTGKTATRRNIRRTKYFREIDRRLMEATKTEARLRCDMRRYLRKLLKRKGPQEDGEFCLLWSARPQFRGRTLLEASKLIKSCLPPGWTVHVANVTNGDDFTGWIFTRLNPHTT